MCRAGHDLSSEVAGQPYAGVWEGRHVSTELSQLLFAFDDEVGC